MHYPLARLLLVVIILINPLASHGVSLSDYLLEARKPNVTPSQFLHKQSQTTPAPTLVLFIHGIFGDTVGTWGNPGKPSLPDYLLKIPEFSQGYDVFAFGYPSEILKQGSFNVPEAAKALKTEWDFNQFSKKYQQVVIVGHSMGGLVALEALSTYSDLRARIPLVVTFATPYDGAQVSTLGDKLISNPALSNMLPREKSNGFITSLGNRWKELKENGKTIATVKCAYETVPIPAIGLIVPPTSGSSLCDGAADAIAENHLGIVKPSTSNHSSVKTLVNALRLLNAPKTLPQGQKTSSRRLLIEEVDTAPLSSDNRFVADKVHRNLTEYLTNLGHIVVAPPISTSKRSEEDEYWRIFSLKVTANGGETSVDFEIKTSDGSIIASTELNGDTKELKANYKVLPEALMYGLDLNETTLISKRSLKLPTKNIAAYSWFLLARRQLELGNITSAQSSLARATAIDKQFAMAYWATGDLLFRQGNKVEAVRYQTRARAIDPDHPKISLSAALAAERPLFAMLDASRKIVTIESDKGLSFSRVRASQFDLDLFVWVVDPKRFQVAVVEQRSPFGNSAKDFLSYGNALVALEGGFFEMDSSKRLSPAGVLVVDGIVRNDAPNRQSGAFVFKQGRYDIVWAKDLGVLSAYSTVVQSGPILVEAPGVNGIRANDFDRLNRAAVCLRREAVVLVSLFGGGGRGLSLYEFAALLSASEQNGGIGCEKALNLDGGPSTQVAFKSSSKDEFIPGVWNVQNALVVRPQK